tara:strand:- start:362 stop:646 length:285 start_codon:yes stop_codon:yes gene_type:complete
VVLALFWARIRYKNYEPNRKMNWFIPLFNQFFKQTGDYNLMDSITKDNALQTAGTVAFVTLVVAGTHALMGFLSDSVNSVSTKIQNARAAKESK